MADKTLCIFMILIQITIVAQARPPATSIIEWKFGAWSHFQGYVHGGMIELGDKVVFKYTPGKHDLVQVDVNGFENCIVPPNAKVFTSGEDVINIDSLETRYYICGIGNHCKEHDMRMRLVITPPYRALLASTQEFVVGSCKGWNENIDYEAWAKGKEFYVGDTLVFNYAKGKHNVIKVDEVGLNQCIIPPDPSEALTSGKDVIPLNAMGDIGFLSSVGKDCENGMRLLINVRCPHARPKPPALQAGRKLVPTD